MTAGPEIIRGDFLEEVYYALRMQGDRTDWLGSREGVGETQLREHSDGLVPGLPLGPMWGLWESLMWEDNAQVWSQALMSPPCGLLC